MRINWTNVVVGVGAGVVDEVLESQDAKAGRVAPFKTWTDWGRVGLAVLGYAGQMTNNFSRFAEPLAQSEVTLLTKSVGKYVRSKTGMSAVVTRTSHAAAPNPTSRRVGWRPIPVGV